MIATATRRPIALSHLRALPVRRVRGRFDSAATTEDNRRHWANADAPANGEAEQVEPMDLVELERNMLLTMPGGWKMSQVEPMRPATTYAEFKKEILNEIGRCLNMPYNVAAGNSSGYNYASGESSRR